MSTLQKCLICYANPTRFGYWRTKECTSDPLQGHSGHYLCERCATDLVVDSLPEGIGEGRGVVQSCAACRHGEYAINGKHKMYWVPLDRQERRALKDNAPEEFDYSDVPVPPQQSPPPRKGKSGKILKNYVCDICGRKFYGKRSSFNDHMLKHKNGPSQCHKCHKKLYSKRHKCPGPQRAEPKKCEHCDTEFSTKQNRERHEAKCELNPESEDLENAKAGRPNDTGFNRVYRLSKELALVVGERRMMRHEVAKKIWSIIKERKLFDPANKQYALCDPELETVFGVKRFRTFGMMMHLKNHLK